MLQLLQHQLHDEQVQEQVVVHDQEQQVLLQQQHNEFYTVHTIALQIFLLNFFYLLEVS